MDDFSKGFFDEFLGGVFADTPALAVIFVIVIAIVTLVLFSKFEDK